MKAILRISIAGSIFLLLLLAACTTGDSEKMYAGLVGAWYGDPDLSNIRYPAIQYSLNEKYDESTGHGRAWSATWVGHLIPDQPGKLDVFVETDKEVILEIDGRQTRVNGENSPGKLGLNVVQGRPYLLSLSFLYSESESGYFRITWQGEEGGRVDIPEKFLVHSASQASYWNWVDESDPDLLDRSEFLRPASTNVIVYYESGRFGGWPANNGIWQWGDEIAVGFSLGYYKANRLHHSIDKMRGSESLVARSLDGGETWKKEQPQYKSPEKTGERIDFSHTDLAIRCGGPDYFVSYDRAHEFMGPYPFPDFGTQKLTPRTDYIINKKDDCLFFLSASEDRVEARLQDRAFCARTTDGGESFKFQSWMTDSIHVRSVMPSTVRIAENHLVSALRRRHDKQFEKRPRKEINWIDVYESYDDGKSWQFLSRVAETDRGKHNGNPPSMVKLKDGRLCVTYGYRSVPYGIRAKLSEDNGKSWSRVIHLRDDSQSWDIGYTRSVQRSDGNIVTIYYYSTSKNEEQHIAATIWDPDKLSVRKDGL